MKIQIYYILFIAFLLSIFSCKKNETNPCPNDIPKIDAPKSLPYTGNETLIFMRGLDSIHAIDTVYYKGQGCNVSYNRVNYYLHPNGCLTDLMVRTFLFKEISTHDSLFIYQSVLDSYSNYNYILFKNKKFITTSDPTQAYNSIDYLYNYWIGNNYYQVQLILDQKGSNFAIVQYGANIPEGANGKGILQFRIDNLEYNLIP